MKAYSLPARAYIIAMRAEELKRQERLVRECIERAQRVGYVARQSIGDLDAILKIGDHNSRLLGNLDYLADYFHILRGILTRQIAEIVREEQAKEGGRGMSGSAHTLKCCDAECAAANHCEVGGIVCENCGMYFCIEDLDENGLCDECANEIAEDQLGICARCAFYGTDECVDPENSDIVTMLCTGFSERT